MMVHEPLRIYDGARVGCAKLWSIHKVLVAFHWAWNAHWSGKYGAVVTCSLLNHLIMMNAEELHPFPWYTYKVKQPWLLFTNKWEGRQGVGGGGQSWNLSNLHGIMAFDLHAQSLRVNTTQKQVMKLSLRRTSVVVGMSRPDTFCATRTELEHVSLLLE